MLSKINNLTGRVKKLQGQKDNVNLNFLGNKEWLNIATEIPTVPFTIFDNSYWDCRTRLDRHDIGKWSDRAW